MQGVSGSGISQQGFYSKPQSPVDDLVIKAEETIRRTNLQNAAKTPAGAALATAKYLAADVLKENIISPEVVKSIPVAKYLNTKAAVNSYKKNGV